MIRLIRFLLKSILLPKQISEFEQQHLEKLNGIAVKFFWLHVPIFVGVAAVNDTGPLWAAIMTTVVALGPSFAFKFLRNPRAISIVHGFTAMIMGGILVHFGQGPVQIEMHFYFFALLAMLAVFGNPMAVLVAAATVAVHHLVLWTFLPASVFNYSAAWWVVAIHALFVVLEATAGVYIARSFFDNVIRLEEIIATRTDALNARNAAMRVVLDTIDQGLVTIDRDGVIAAEYSKAFETWFGAPAPGATLVDHLRAHDPNFASNFEMAFEQCTDGFLPVAISIAQAPRQFATRDCHYRLQYYPTISADGVLETLLLVIADATDQVLKEKLEVDARETVALLSYVAQDRDGLIHFLSESLTTVQWIIDGARLPQTDENRRDALRAVHTLKGNAMLYGAQSLSSIAHKIESCMIESGGPAAPHLLNELEESWDHFASRAKLLVGEIDSSIRLSDEVFHKLLRATVEKHPYEQILSILSNFKTESTEVRLVRLADQAKEMAKRLNKQGLSVEIDHNDLRLDTAHWATFWGSFVHVLRNAIDHGLPTNEDEESGAHRKPKIRLQTALEESGFVISLEDNGQGIDWERVREKAVGLGLPADTQDDLIAALFSDGFSTKEELTEFSGRGVGLAAVRRECELRDGRVEISNVPGGGTGFRFHFSASHLGPHLDDDMTAASMKHQAV